MGMNEKEVAGVAGWEWMAGAPCRLVLRGSIDAGAAEGLAEMLRERLGGSSDTLDLDLSSVDFIDLAGLQSLLHAAAVVPHARLRHCPPTVTTLVEAIGHRLPPMRLAQVRASSRAGRHCYDAHRL